MNTLTIETSTELDSNQIAIDRARMELLKDRLAKLVITIPAKPNYNKGSDMGRIATCGSNRIVLGGQH